MAVRNFWVEANIDGRETKLAGGPRSKDGGMQVIITQRNKGGIMTAYVIDCWADGDGNLHTDVRKGDDGLPCTHNKTER